MVAVAKPDVSCFDLLPPPNHKDFCIATGAPKKSPDKYFASSSCPSEPVANPNTPTWSIFPAFVLPIFEPYTPALIWRTVDACMSYG